jgi:adenylate cyclase
MARLTKAVTFGIVIAAVGVGLSLTPLGARLEDGLGLPWLFWLRGPVAPPPEVVVVSIDKASSDQIGLNKDVWPPPRHVHADVVRSLTTHGVSAIVMDIFFRVPRSAPEDTDLADAIRGSGRVTLFENVGRQQVSGGEIFQTRAPIGQLREAAIAVGAFPLPDSALVHFFWAFFDGTEGQTPTLPAVALQIHALPLLDRLVALLKRAGVRNLADLPAQVGSASESRHVMRVLRRELEHNPEASARARALLDEDAPGGGEESTRRLLAALVRLYSGNDRYYLNFYGPPGSIRTIPFHEVLQHGTDLPELKNAVVFVGEGASELVRNAEQGDAFRTVYSTDEGLDLSGAEIAATAFANLLTDRALRPVRFGTQVAMLIGIGLLIGMVLRVLPGRYALVAAIATAAAYYGLAQHQFTARARLLPLAVPLVAQLPLALFVVVLSRYLTIRKQVPREVEAGERPELVRGVCLSTDIENYVVVSQDMEPRDLAALMNDYYATLSTLVANRGGMMVGRAGDSAMCVWTGTKREWPFTNLTPAWLSRRRRADLDRRTKACLTALEIRQAIVRFNARHSTHELPTRIGLHAGDLALGPVGGEYHVIGDTANAASRIEGLNKHLATTLLASDVVIQDVAGLCVRPVGKFVLPGRTSELSIVEIIGRAEDVDQGTWDLCRRFAAALNLFEKKLWADAAQSFEAIASNYPADGPTRYYRAVSERRSSDSQATYPAAIRIEIK